MERKPRKRSAAPKRPARAKKPSANPPSPSPASPQPLSASSEGAIRMSRQGLGDCFLISLPRTDGGTPPYYVMIDCGVILGTADPSTMRTRVGENIATVTQGEIDLLIGTHEHWDHLSGFVQAKDTFDNKLKVHEVWLGWTEDARDALTAKLKAEKNAALASLRFGLSRMQLAGDADGSAELSVILEFFGAANGASTSDALDNV